MTIYRVPSKQKPTIRYRVGKHTIMITPRQHQLIRRGETISIPQTKKGGQVSVGGVRGGTYVSGARPSVPVSRPPSRVITTTPVVKPKVETKKEQILKELRGETLQKRAESLAARQKAERAMQEQYKFVTTPKPTTYQTGTLTQEELLERKNGRYVIQERHLKKQDPLQEIPKGIVAGLAAPAILTLQVGAAIGEKGIGEVIAGAPTYIATYPAAVVSAAKERPLFFGGALLGAAYGGKVIGKVLPKSKLVGKAVGKIKKKLPITKTVQVKKLTGAVKVKYRAFVTTGKEFGARGKEWILPKVTTKIIKVKKIPKVEAFDLKKIGTKTFTKVTTYKEGVVGRGIEFTGYIAEKIKKAPKPTKMIKGYGPARLDAYGFDWMAKPAKVPKVPLDFKLGKVVTKTAVKPAQIIKSAAFPIVDVKQITPSYEVGFYPIPTGMGVKAPQTQQFFEKVKLKRGVGISLKQAVIQKEKIAPILKVKQISREKLKFRQVSIPTTKLKIMPAMKQKTAPIVSIKPMVKQKGITMRGFKIPRQPKVTARAPAMFPPFLPMGKYRKPRKISYFRKTKIRQPKRYTPSLLGIFSEKRIMKAPKGIITGFGIRYPVKKRRAKKRKKRR